MRTSLGAALAALMLATPGTALADFRMEGTRQFWLPPCGSAPGPLRPRLPAPPDAAPWLPNRNWDVRDMTPCARPSKVRAQEVKVMPKVRERVIRSAPNVRTVPQK